MPKYVKGIIIFINAIALKIAKKYIICEGKCQIYQQKLITSCYFNSIGTLPLCQQVLLVNKNTREMVIGRVLKEKDKCVYSISSLNFQFC